jgi:hypothetical protein
LCKFIRFRCLPVVRVPHLPALPMMPAPLRPSGSGSGCAWCLRRW